MLSHSITNFVGPNQYVNKPNVQNSTVVAHAHLKQRIHSLVVLNHAFQPFKNTSGKSYSPDNRIRFVNGA